MQPILASPLTPLVAAALDASLPAGGELPAGETELIVALEGNVGGMHYAAGLHGRLVVKPRSVHHDVLIERTIALLLGHLTPAKRAAVAGKLATAAAKSADKDLPYLRDAQKLTRSLRKKTGVEFHATPTYKPKV